MNYDFDMYMAEREIERTYGEKVSIVNKAKTLRKFGRTINADSGVATTVATFQGAVINETFATTNSVDYIVSDSASDTGTVSVEGAYFDADNNLVFNAQDVTLTGLTPVALGTALCRCNRIKVKKGTFAAPAAALVGNVYVYDATLATGVTAGVPDVAAATKCMVVAGQNQSAKLASMISGSDYYVLTDVYAAVQKGNANTVAVDLDVEYREIGGVWLPLGLEMSLRTGGASTLDMPQRPYSIIPKNSDFRMVATSNTNDTTVSGHVHGYLAQVREAG